MTTTKGATVTATTLGCFGLASRDRMPLTTKTARYRLGRGRAWAGLCGCRVWMVTS